MISKDFDPLTYMKNNYERVLTPDEIPPEYQRVIINPTGPQIIDSRLSYTYNAEKGKLQICPEALLEDDRHGFGS